MEYFHSSGGNNRPDFPYRFTVDQVTEDMYKWCENFPSNGPFERFHIIWNSAYVLLTSTQNNDLGDHKEIPMIQFESKNAAYWFRIAFSECILEDVSYA